MYYNPKSFNQEELLSTIAARLQPPNGSRKRYPDKNGEYWTLCPFHDDKGIGSFSFNPYGFNCFSCGASGNLSQLAQKLGIHTNGGQNFECFNGITLTQYAVAKQLPEDFLKSLDLFFETDNYVFVHAGLREKVPLDEQVPEDLLWVRHKFIKSDFDFGKRIIFGHTPLAQPLVQPNKIGIDTGAVYGNKLTCVKLLDLKFYHV